MRGEWTDQILRNYPTLRISLAYASQDQRPKLLALYGLLGAIEECLYQASDPVVSNAKLAWWHEELQQAKAGKGNHPLSQLMHSSGALSAWPSAFIGNVFNLAGERVEAAAVNDKSGLLQLCESMGLVHLELEAAVQQVPVQDQNVIRQLAGCNGLMQLFRESFKSRHATYYWVPLSDCARLGIERQQIAQYPFQAGTCQVLYDVSLCVVDQKRMSQNFDLLAELPPAWVSRCRHWLLQSLLQQRQLFRLQRGLARSGSSADMNRCLQQVGLTDSLFAWQAARLLNAIGEEGRE